MIRELKVVPPAEFEKLYLAEGFISPDAVEGLTRSEYQGDKAFIEDELRRRLSERWVSPDDFEVAWDENVALHSCGGIYSYRILGMDYANIVDNVLQQTRRPAIWGYHTAVEPEDAFTGFWIRNGSIYAPDNGFSWQKFFKLS